MKRCTKCDKDKDIGCFSKKGSGTQSRCKNCVSEWYRDWYQKNWASESRRAIKNNRRIRDENRVKLLEYLLTHPCVRCAESDPLVLQFHHLGEKSADVSMLANGSYAWSTVLKEIAKCIVLCSNCHDRETATLCGNWKLAALAQSGRAAAL